MWKVRELADKVTNVVMNYTEIESKVREATNDDPWGPTGTIKHELSQATYSYDQFPEVMGMLWKRIAENKQSPRRIYKSLLLLHHLLLHGSDRVVRAAQDRLYEIRSLQDYHAIYEPGFNINAIIPASGTETKDGELNVRVKAKELVELAQDEERLREDRKKAKKNRDKYVGIGSDRMMTSKWTDNDYGGGYDDEFGSGRKSRSPSPPSKSKFKPFSDESDIKRSSNSNSFSSNHSSSFRTKPGPPSPGIEVSDDFDPRATEKSSADFGDFTSAAAKSNNISSPSSINAFGSPPRKEAGGDFADFQSAFGGTSTSSMINISPEAQNTTNNTKGDDLLGLSFDIGGNVAAPQPSSTNNNASFLPPNLFPNPLPTQQPISFPMSNNPVQGFPAFGSNSNVTPPAQSPVGQLSSGFQTSPSGGGFPAFAAAVAPAPAQPQSLPISQPLIDPAIHFGGNDILTPILEPAKSSNTANGSVANSSATNNNNNHTNKQSLKGTTWSDLNISIDDLNLGRSNGKNSSGSKTPMNQLRPSATPSSNTFGGFP